MSSLGYVLEVYNKISITDGWDSNPSSVIYNLADISVDLNKGINQKDTASFVIPESEWDNIGYDYIVRIIRVIDTEYSYMSDSEKENNTIFVGVVNSIQIDESAGNFKIVKLISFIEYLFNTPISLDLEDKTIVEILQEAINQYNAINTYRNISWSSSNPTTRSDGSDFEIESTYVSDNKPFLEILEELSGSQYTHDGNYIYFVNPLGDNTFELVWKKPDTTEINYDYYITREIQYGTTAVKTQLIYSLGDSPLGSPVRDTYIDVSLASEYGVNVKFTNEFHNVIGEIIRYEKIKNPGDFSGNNIFPDSYPYVFAMSGVSVSDEEEYDNEIQKLAKIIGKQLAKQWLYKQKIKVSEKIEYPASINPLPIQVGERVNKDYSEIGRTNVDMICSSIKFSSKKVVIKLDEYLE